MHALLYNMRLLKCYARLLSLTLTLYYVLTLTLTLYYVLTLTLTLYYLLTLTLHALLCDVHAYFKCYARSAC
jgi:hypothetical protein